MKMMFRFAAARSEFRKLVGSTIHTEIQRPDMHFTLSSRVFDLGPETWYTLGFDYRRDQMTGRAFIDTYENVRDQMRTVYQDLQIRLKRQISWLSYDTAATWISSRDGKEYARIANNPRFKGLNGSISANQGARP